MAKNDLLTYAALGIGGFLIYDKFLKGPRMLNAQVTVPVGTPPEVITCLTRKADRGWSAKTCEDRLGQLRAAFNATKAKMQASAGTAEYQQWADANRGHQGDFYALTGIWLA